MEKFCPKCGEIKQSAEFSKDATRSDGLQSGCKACRKIENAKYRADNREKEMARYAKYYAANAGEIKKYSAKYRADNTKMCKAYNDKYRADNTEKVKAARARWEADNKEARRILNQNRRARKRANGGKLSKDITERLFTLQRGKCACGCRQPLGNGYHMDHILPIALGGSNTDDNIQLLRAKCNLQKHARHPVDFMRQRGFLL